MADTLKTPNVMLSELQDQLDYDVCPNNVSNAFEQWQDQSNDSYPLVLDFQYDRGKVIGRFIVLTFLFTYTVTLLKSSIAIRSKRNGREPPMVPYWIPFMGNLLPFISDPYKYCTEIKCDSTSLLASAGVTE